MIYDIDVNEMRARLAADTLGVLDVDAILDAYESVVERVAAVRATCDAGDPKDADGRPICLYGENDEPCMSHCDCSWGSVGTWSIREILDGTE